MVPDNNSHLRVVNGAIFSAISFISTISSLLIYSELNS